MQLRRRRLLTLRRRRTPDAVAPLVRAASGREARRIRPRVVREWRPTGARRPAETAPQSNAVNA
jgi:hypothetical protein